VGTTQAKDRGLALVVILLFLDSDVAHYSAVFPSSYLTNIPLPGDYFGVTRQ